MISPTMDPRLGKEKTVGFLRNAIPAIVCGLTGFLSAFTVSLVGLLPIGELILLVVCPWSIAGLIKNKRWRSRIQQLSWYKLLLISLGITALGYFASDLYRGTPTIYQIRGWARVSFLIIDIIAIAHLIDNSWVRLRIFVFAFFIGGITNSFLTGPLFEHWWEFGVGAPVTGLALYVVAGLPAIIQMGVAAVIGATSIVLSARSLGGIALLSGVLYGVRFAHGVKRPLVFLAAAGAMVVVVFAAQQTAQENPDKISSNIERTSMIETAAESFLGSPIVGQGTWYSTSRMMRQIEQHRQAKDPNFHGYSEEEASTITIHSQILTALAEAGILGGAFFLVYGVLILKTLRTLTKYPVPHREFVLYLLVDGLWNLCMSPFSGASRVSIGLVVCTSLLVILQRQDELSDNYRE